MRRMALALAAVIASALGAGAVLPGQEAQGDARRFGLDRDSQAHSSLSRRRAAAAAARFNGAHGGIGPAGVIAGRGPGGLRVRAGDAARVFLAESQDLLGVDPSSLVLDREASGAGHHHALFHQTYQGLPVEFSRVKVHLNDNGAVLDVNASGLASGAVDVSPGVAEATARQIAAADAGSAAVSPGELVILADLHGSGPARLAWKISTRGRQALWRYYVDARTGAVLFRYNELRHVCASPVQGTVTGLIYEVDPLTAPGFQPHPFAHQRVFVGDGTHYASTDQTGFYCGPAVGKVFTQLQGDFVNVSSFRGPSAHYDNGSGVWQTVATPVSSPHPYPANSVLISTIDLSGFVAPGAVELLPVFTTINVGRVATGSFGEALDFTANDEVSVIDPFGNPVGSYVGNIGPINAAAIPGTVLRLRLKSSALGTGYGYDVSLSSYLVLNSPFTVGANNSFQWYAASHTATGLRSEINLFYHLNLMHDYLSAVLGSSSATYLSGATHAMAFTGPSLTNAFYEPDTDNLFFGDISAVSPSDAFTDDATVPHHEYTHYMVEKIWPIQNFGQAGAISEANADYFSASSFGSPLAGSHYVSGIGLYVSQAFGNTVAIRQLDSAVGSDLCGPSPAVYSPITWQGEIHCDSRFLGQALWDIRKARVALQGQANGQACVDGLAFQTLLFFPESFSEYLSAMLRVDAAGAVAACGGPSSVQATITTAFANHGLSPTPGVNSGFETAIDVSTTPSISGAIAAAGQVNFYTFASGPGPISVTLALPSAAPFYKAYTLTLYDLNHAIVAQAAPPFDGTNTNSGFCLETDCTTTASTVILAYNNNASGGQFYVEVAGGETFSGGSNSGVHSATPYGLQFSFSRAKALTSSIVTAVIDRDVISYKVAVATFPRTQDYSFAYAQLRDQAQNVLPGTRTNFPPLPGDYLVLLTSSNALGAISGTVQLQNQLSARFPSVGTVYLEVFGYNVVGSTVSLGLSQALNLTTTLSDVHAWNNVFDPATGQKATVKYDLQAPGRLTMRLYTLSGGFVSTLFDDAVPAGKGSVDWAGRNAANNLVASGIYLLRVEGPGVRKTVKLAVVK